MEQRILSGYSRSADRSVERLEAPVTTDLLGTAIVYYAVIDGAAHISTSVRALCGRLGRVDLNPLALPEALAFGLTLRDESVVAQVRSIPPHSTLHPDGTLSRHAGPVSTGAIGDAAVASQKLRGVLDGIVRAEEDRYQFHCVGYTGGKDSRILAAHFISVSGRDDAEHKGASAHAQTLGLAHHAWMEWTSDFVAPPAHRISADLANGVGAVSDSTLLRTYFERYRETVLGRRADDAGVALWIGALADSLLAGTYLPPLAPAAATIWDALAPRTAQLPRVLAPALVQRFEAESALYATNPFSFTPASDDEVGMFIRLFTKGRAYICRLLSCFDRVCPTQLNPYLHPAVIELALSIDPRLRVADALRSGVLADLGPGLDAPSAFGYRAPGYSGAVLSALSEEARRCSALDSVLEPALLAELRDNRHPDLGAPLQDGKPAYRSHAAEPVNIYRSLRDYEHVLTYATFLNLLSEDGVVISG
jgi:hypothetical protein